MLCCAVLRCGALVAARRTADDTRALTHTTAPKPTLARAPLNTVREGRSVRTRSAPDGGGAPEFDESFTLLVRAWRLAGGWCFF